MGLYDVMSDIAAKQVTKSETGDNRMDGLTLGVVQKNYDQEMPGRVCVEIPVRDKSANELKWARVIMPSSGKKWGHYFLPEVGDQVVLAFENGNIEKPYVVGCVPKDSNSFLTGSVDENNQIKRIVTKNGSTIQFDDVADKDGKEDKITIMTANKSHKVILDNENNKILLTDGENKNFISMITDQGNIAIQAQSKVTIKVGDTISVTMNGESGGIKVQCNQLKVEASDSAQIETSGKLGLKGGTFNADASATFKINSSGIVSVSGSPIKLG